MESFHYMTCLVERNYWLLVEHRLVGIFGESDFHGIRFSRSVSRMWPFDFYPFRQEKLRLEKNIC